MYFFFGLCSILHYWVKLILMIHFHFFGDDVIRTLILCTISPTCPPFSISSMAEKAFKRLERRMAVATELKLAKLIEEDARQLHNRASGENISLANNLCFVLCSLSVRIQ